MNDLEFVFNDKMEPINYAPYPFHIKYSFNPDQIIPIKLIYGDLYKDKKTNMWFGTWNINLVIFIAIPQMWLSTNDLITEIKEVWYDRYENNKDKELNNIIKQIENK